MKQGIKTILSAVALIATLIFTNGCTTQTGRPLKVSLSPLAPDGSPGAFVSFSSSTQTTQTEAQRAEKLAADIAAMRAKLGAQPVNEGDVPEKWQEPEQVKKTVGQHIKDTLWDWRNGVETSKSLAGLVITAGAASYAAGIWDFDDITGGGDDKEANETRRRQADALRANAERDKQVIRGNNNDVTLKDASQNDGITLEGDNNTLTVDFQQDTEGF